MRLYLVQHGDALSKDIDPDRPLSDKGRADVGSVAQLMAKAGTEVSNLLHSVKSRARQTAEIISAELGCEGAVSQREGLKAMDPVEDWASKASGLDGDTMLVGHMPFMDKLACRLIGLDESAEAFGFLPGTVLCLETDGGSSWQVVWMLRPSLSGTFLKGLK
ncbi:phosphohistidine phosphatase SixA [Candidatus Fermentibacteria bacterium]|nr:phosphohistidine phosphatase SixA [Candidatus Fermentibacteria bacterium]